VDINTEAWSSVEKPPRNSAGFYGGGKGLNWAVEPRKEEVLFGETYKLMKLFFMQSSPFSLLPS
jgi:hypothetical protein